MKIGILTFHSQLNYGGVLQCWALQTALEKLGHEVVVIDRWLHADNRDLECGFNKWRLGFWTKFLLCAIMGLGDWARLQRVRKTKRFLKTYLNLTPYHFVEWKDAPKDLGVDLLVVGSDQVWHCGDWGDPRPYLLEDAPRIPAIAYAASFGMVAIPQFISNMRKDIEAKPFYERGLGRFKSVSCRETEGVRICEKFGIHAEHVVDPTLLLTSTDWKPIVGDCDGNRKRKPSLVCYFLSEKIDEALPVLEEFAAHAKCTVKVLVHSDMVRLLPFPSGCGKFKVWARGIWNIVFGDVQMCMSAGPGEFVKAFANASWVVSDSFHALMFATVFKKQVRILRPKTEFRLKMFARIEELDEHADGPLIVDSVATALASFANGEKVAFDYDWLSTRRQASQSCLTSAITSNN